MAGEQKTQEDYLSMSDEELLKAGSPPSAPVEEQRQEDPTTNTEVDGADDEQKPDDPDAAGGDDPDQKPNGDEDPNKSDDPDAPDTPDTPNGGEGGKEESKPTDTGTKPVDKPRDTPKDEVKPDAEAEIAKLLKPFKANGRDMQVANVDEAIALMQMGANYNKKMAGLKPSLKILKYLENNDLLDEGKLSFLVDLHKKDPAAINKLVKDSGIDVTDLDASKADSYKRTTASVDEREVDLDTVLDEIKDSSGYTRTLSVVTKEWDSNSKNTIAEAPQLLKVINTHVENGIYDLISTELTKQRALGKLDGLSDIQAYQRIGDAMNSQGKFNHLGRQEETKPVEKVVVAPKLKKPEDDKLKARRLAAGSTKPAGSSTVAKDFNPLAMSDAEFSKQVKSQFL